MSAPRKTRWRAMECIFFVTRHLCIRIYYRQPYLILQERIDGRLCAEWPIVCVDGGNGFFDNYQRERACENERRPNA
jgi:hypothetical protein